MGKKWFKIAKADRHPVGLFCCRCEHHVEFGAAYVEVGGVNLCVACASSSEVPGVVSV